MEFTDCPTVPDLVIAMAPYMERLKELEKEVVELRLAKNCGAPDVEKLFADGGWKFRQDHKEGKWWYTMPTHGPATGGGNFTTLKDAIKNAISRTREMEFVEEDECDC